MESTPRVSVITACLPSAADHLEKAAESIREAKEHLDLEWLLVFDGPGEVEAPLGADRVITMPRQRGVSVARNFALSYSSSPLLTNLDADDELAWEGLLAAVERLEENPQLGWLALNRVLTDGSKTVHWHGQRSWALGEVAETWSAPMAFHSNTLLMRTAHVKRVGGWPALPACQDLGLCLLLSELSPGESMGQVLIRYRAWEGQNTASASFREEQAHAYKFIEESISLVRLEQGRLPILAPVPLGGLGSKAV